MTMSVEARLTELGINLPTPATPVANYVTARISGDHLYLSGHVGKRDGEMVSDDAYVLARATAIDMLASVRAALGSLDRVAGVVKVSGFINSAPDFTEQPAVLNGASDLLVEVFGLERGRHARTAVGVAQLPLGAAIEIEAVFAVA
ncbi:MAG: RidA family protein [Chloroflexi bacterium]|nr:MAG: RidA family protein [Chloroflexota bacterium]